ncbi:flagellar hook capping FlgD N-terminal domain-containing protein [Breoghania sp.]|uniref:flagellar hook assembly protein FlgD n=1 Tax=Breoghania sp. TaxID=2065378 RepID=UPI0029CA341C|nr:flagellar hook capping FlgD N-terminal domain-containing protein [Breoghania sp.]
MVEAVSGSSSAGYGAASTTTNALSANYQMFLSLLTSQLKAQDPLDPLKADEFTNQLVQYSSVEQQIKMNSSLDALIAKTDAANASNLVSYIGKRVSAEGTQSVLTDGYATWEFKSPAAAEDAVVTIRNSAGVIVYKDKVDLSKGTGAYVWDGRMDRGGTAADGTYSISFEAKDAAGKNVSVKTEASGVVDSIDFSGAEPVLKMGDLSIPLSTVTSVTAAI